MGLISRVSSRTYRFSQKSTKKSTMAVVKVTKPRVPEALAKKRSRYASQAASAAKAKVEAKKSAVLKRREIIKKARANEAEYKAQVSASLANKRAAKEHGNFFVEGEPKLALVVRIRGINQISPKPKKVLQLLRLRQIGNAVFIRLNKASIQMLRLADPFITWGYPSIETIKKLIYKRGAGNINGQRIKLSNNGIIETGLGKLGINCIEDLIHEIYTVGPNFREANNWLFPIKLSCAKGGWQKITNHFIEGGDFGNREQFINNLIKKINKKFSWRNI